MNQYQEKKYDREVGHLSSSQLETKLKMIKSQIAQSLLNNKKKVFRHKQQERNIVEKHIYS